MCLAFRQDLSIIQSRIMLVARNAMSLYLLQLLLCSYTVAVNSLHVIRVRRRTPTSWTVFCAVVLAPRPLFRIVQATETQICSRACGGPLRCQSSSQFPLISHPRLWHQRKSFTYNSGDATDTAKTLRCSVSSMYPHRADSRIHLNSRGNRLSSAQSRRAAGVWDCVVKYVDCLLFHLLAVRALTILSPLCRRTPYSLPSSEIAP
ncbi:hypothetical protein BDY19DRAFT_153212 [Irpex rosettiformis]|uniref:Uncharacterized protein n=1 Tax=Irpex rosettiformis TaxID=378272 RepID=A0ACB8U4I3_9APHY|nr:hypothetical protein BDY19DRAFT_153212 [Irpex rosettiformis]